MTLRFELYAVEELTTILSQRTRALRWHVDESIFPLIAETDDTEHARRVRLSEINGQPGGREALEAAHGRVWDTSQLAEEFEVIGFLAPFVVVRRKSDRAKGSLEFQHNARFYFNFQPD